MTHAIEVLESKRAGVYLGTPDAIALFSDKLSKLGISHVVLFNHKYYNTHFGIQEGY